MKNKVLLYSIFLFLIGSGVLSAQSWKKVVRVHDQIVGNEQSILKKGGMHITDYGSPPFNNPNYYYAAVQTAPTSVWYRQAGLSPNGQKIVAQKSYTDGIISRTEIVLMNSDGSNETIISEGNSGVGDIYAYMNPFWSKDGSAIGYAEVHNTSSNKIVRYILSSSSSSYIYLPGFGLDANNPDFLGSSTTTIVFWDVVSGFADLFTWDGASLTNITNTSTDKEYEPVSNATGDKIVYWSGETVGEPTNTTHTLTNVGGVWTKDVGFTPIVDSYWPYWSSRSDNYIGVTVMSSQDVKIYNSNGTFSFDLTGPGYSGGAGQWNFLGSGFEGPNGEMVMGSNASRVNPGRDIVFATPRTKLFVNASTGNDLFPGTGNAPFATIGKAINEAITGATINVAAGNYTEIGQIVIDKNLSIIGADKTTTIIKPAQNTSNSGNTRGWFLINLGVTFNLSNVTLDGTGKLIFMGLYYWGNGTVDNCNITNIKYNESTNYEGRGMIIKGNVNVTNCSFTQMGRIGIQYYGGGGTASGNTFTGKGAGNWLDYGFDIGNGAIVNVLNNSISNNYGVALSDGSTSGAVIVGTYFGPGTTATITNNTLTGNTVGIAVGPDVFGASTVIAHNNNLSGNSEYGIFSTAASVDGTNNWWGSSLGPLQVTTNNTSGTGSKVSDNVLYDPWTLNTINTMLNNPINGNTGESVVPKLIWNDVTGEAGFLVKISTDGIASGGLIAQHVFNNHVRFTKTLATSTLNYQTVAAAAADAGIPLDNLIKYFWQVSVIGGASNGFASPIYHFTTIQDLGVNLSTPTGTVYSSPVSFNWYLNTSMSGLSYIVQYKCVNNSAPAPASESFWSGAGFTPLSATTNLFSPPQTVLLGKTYYWRVLVQRTINSITSYVYYPAYNVYNIFTTAGGSTVTCYPSWPLNLATVYTNRPTVYWYLDQYSPNLTYIVRYSKHVDTDGSGKLNNADAIELSPTSNFYEAFPSDLDRGTQYWWQVQATYTDDNSKSAWSSLGSFTTNGPGTLQVPVPSYPTGGVGVIVYTVNPIFYWYLNTAASGLWYEINIEPTSVVTLDGTVQYKSAVPDVDKLYLQISGLTPGVSYHYKIRSKNVSGDPNGSQASGWSSEQFFTVAGGMTASYAVASWPLSGTVYTNHPTLSWYLEGSNLGITGYQVKYKKDSAPGDWTTYGTVGVTTADGGAYSLSDATFSQQIGADLAYGGTYYWAVFATGTSNPINSFGVGSFTVVGGPNATTVELSTPSDGSTVYNTSPTLYWYVDGSTLGIDYYIIQYSQSDVFASPVEVHSNSLSTIIGTNGAVYNGSGPDNPLTPGATYWWQVKAHYSSDPQPASFTPQWSFNVQVGSSNVVQPIVGGPNNIIINATSPMLSWVIPTPASGGLRYEVQYSDNPSFLNAHIVTDIINPQTVISGLSANSRYYWRVRSKAADGTYSYFSNTGKFGVGENVLSVKDKEVIPTQFFVGQNYPNPFNPSTIIKYGLPEATNVSIKVYNMLGQEVKTLVNDYKSAGTFSVNWNGDNNSGSKVSSGTYIFRVISGSNIKTMKMVLLK
jgi:hypothetical protein